MKKLLFPLIFCTLLWSGCTVSHISYVRNFRENAVRLDLHFIQEAAPYLPSDLKIPYSKNVHLVEESSSRWMQDTLVAKRTTLTSYRVELPSGAMLMWDRKASAQTRNYSPLRMDVISSDSAAPQTVYIESSDPSRSSFQTKGNRQQLRWFDVR